MACFLRFATKPTSKLKYKIEIENSLFPEVSAEDLLVVIPVLPKNYSIFSKGSKDKLNFLLKFLQGPLDSERKKIFEL